ncbi:MAG: DUF6497 family protein [Gemmobacter sp.]
MTDPVLPAGDPIPVPSGQEVRLLDVIHNEPGTGGLTVRYRFIAPAIGPGGDVDFETAAADMEHLCQTYALPRVVSGGPRPAQIVISLSDMAVPFGAAAPEATQFFEAYSLDGDTCIWEPF